MGKKGARPFCSAPGVYLEGVKGGEAARPGKKGVSSSGEEPATGGTNAHRGKNGGRGRGVLKTGH